MTKTIAHALTLSPPNREEIFHLNAGDHLRFASGIYVVRVIGGRAWMTHYQRDITLKAGESIAVVMQKGRAAETLLSSLGRDPLEVGISRIA